MTPLPNNCQSAGGETVELELFQIPKHGMGFLPRPPKMFRTVFQCRNWVSTGGSRGGREPRDGKQPVGGKPWGQQWRTHGEHPIGHGAFEEIAPRSARVGLHRRSLRSGS